MALLPNYIGDDSEMRKKKEDKAKQRKPRYPSTRLPAWVSITCEDGQASYEVVFYAKPDDVGKKARLVLDSLSRHSRGRISPPMEV